ncbi:MAG: leucine-rich repeat protein [Lachnospiraceae bacterium]|nr:leucine-rich repeat protein [Lachnospiraceae bacterium]
MENGKMENRGYEGTQRSRKIEEAEIAIEGGSLRYIKREQDITITAFSGLASEVAVPGEIAGGRVVSIAKKAFLSKKNLRKVALPDTLREVGDWAFAYCDNLQQVEFYLGDVAFGKAVFLECGRLQALRIREKEEAVAALLAAAVTTADAPYLLNLEEAGERAWLAKWDARMLAILHSEDTEGYSKQVLCGEEDYGSTDLDAYTSGRRRVKVRLGMLRLLNDVGLEQSVRQELREYLCAHGKGCGSEETWQVILQEHGDERAYFQLLTKLGCVTEENFADMLADMGEEHPEMKAYMLRYQAEELTRTDFFDSMDLDL